MNYECLINREHKCPNKIGKLVETNSSFKQTLHGEDAILLEEKTYQAFVRLQKEAESYGFHFEITSGYRSREYQQELLEYYIEKYGFEMAIQRVALPNYSEHQSGLAIDFCYIKNLGETKEEDIEEDSQEFIWLKEHLHEYGFILRYPKGKEEITKYIYEPWHIRYVGNPLATILHESGDTLEEYYEKTTIHS